MAKTASIIKLQSNQEAPNFRLKTTDEKIYTLESFKSKTLLIIFICNHCPYVKARIKDIIELQNKFPKEELQIVGINSNDPSYEGEGFENMKKFTQEYGVNFTYLFDETQEVARSYGAVCTPDPFLFDQNRRLVFHGKINNALDPSATPTEHIMENNIRLILQGQRVEKDFDPSIGCSIKWKT